MDKALLQEIHSVVSSTLTQPPFEIPNTPKVVFPDFINKIGIEFEGFYSTRLGNYLHRYSRANSDSSTLSNIIDNYGTDGSLCGSDHTYGLEGREVRTRPLSVKELNDVLSMYDLFFSTGDYRINNSVGLHFHVSFKESYYAGVMNEYFYNLFVRRYKKAFPNIFETRNKNGEYASAEIENKRNHFYRLGNSSQRRAMVNYCYGEHKTVEIRAYGGRYATIHGLADCINIALKTMGDSIKKIEKETCINNVVTRDTQDAITDMTMPDIVRGVNNYSIIF